MARIIGPMHSDDARGEYGGPANGVVFSAWGNKRYAKRAPVDPEHPLTIPVVGHRAFMRLCHDVWTTFDSSQKAYWKAYGAGIPLPGFQAFEHYNMLQAEQGWGPQLVTNAEHMSAPAAPTALAATVIRHFLRITWTDAALAYTTFICAGTEVGFTPIVPDGIYSCLTNGGEDRQATVKLDPGTYYLKAFSADEDGGTGVATASVGPLVIV
jgi:hypothetical protein